MNTSAPTATPAPFDRALLDAAYALADAWAAAAARVASGEAVTAASAEPSGVPSGATPAEPWLPRSSRYSHSLAVRADVERRRVTRVHPGVTTTAATTSGQQQQQQQSTGTTGAQGGGAGKGGKGKGRKK